MRVQVCRERRIPVIADEVFTGLWRLGRISAMSMLDRKPDIACYAKLLTGGTVPMSVTLASEAVFDAFDGDTKASALLHGHSYTAHPIGCQVCIFRWFCSAQLHHTFQFSNDNPCSLNGEWQGARRCIAMRASAV
jgi:dethiobiotin synthetase/adenosylmethionine--8-amino-7-oxononanoate aminotransferase